LLFVLSIFFFVTQSNAIDLGQLLAQRDDLERSAQRDDFERSAQRDDLGRSAQRDDFERSAQRDDLGWSAQRDDFERSAQRDDLERSAQRDDFERSAQRDDLEGLRKQVELDSKRIDLQNVTALDLQELVRKGRVTYREITQMYLNRIALYDFNTIKINSVRVLNPNALEEAERCDLAFAANPSVAKGMFGIPVLVKDNVNVVGMPTTAGSVALADNYAPYDAWLVTQLKEAGVVILGKANLTEFANFIAIGMPTGFSSLGGQVLNPYRPVRLLGDTLTLRPSGSSAGSGAAAAAALAAITIGTETSGSILSPAFANSIVAIKPTVGLISRYGVIPISSSQDTGGPMGRTVTDVAILLNVLAGYDSNDDATQGIEAAGASDVDYTLSLKLNDLKGKRIGLIGIPPEEHTSNSPFQQAVQALRDAGAEIVTKPDGTALTFYNPDDPNTNPTSPRSIVLDYDFAKDLPAYLATLDRDYPIKTIQDVINFNNEYMKIDSAAFPYGQAIFERCAILDLEEKREQFLTERATDLLYARDNGIDYLLKEYQLDGLVGTSQFGSPTVIGAKAGYPTVSIPLANLDGMAYPINLTFTGTAFSEAQLIEFAYVVEQATHFRTPPGLAEKSNLGAAIRSAQKYSDSAQQYSDAERAAFQELFDSVLSIYHSNFSTQHEVDHAEAVLCIALEKIKR